MRKLIITGMAVAMLAVPAAASANAPDGTYTVAPKANEHASVVGKLSSQIKQNGQFVSGNGESISLGDQTTTPGSRAEIVQDLLGH